VPRRALAILVVCAAAWGIAFAAWSVSPATFDFIALYSSARLVALGRAAEVTDREAIAEIEHEIRPERTRFLNNPNPPVVSLLLAPLGFLPFELAYGVMLTLLVATLAAAAILLGALAPPERRRRLFPFAMLGPPALIALVQGQTTPLILLALAGALRASPRWSGLLLGLTAMRPQFLPLFAVAALLDRERRWPFVAVVAAVAAASFALVGPSGIPGYLELVTYSAAELRPVDLGLASLMRRFGVGEDALVNLAISAVALAVGAVAILRERDEDRVVRASTWSLVAAPHALPHDGILAYPTVAARSETALATVAWVGSGLLVSIVHQTGLPIASLWLLALALWPRSRS